MGPGRWVVWLCQMAAVRARSRCRTRAMTPAGVRPPWRWGPSWALRVWKTDSMIWRGGRAGADAVPRSTGSGWRCTRRWPILAAQSAVGSRGCGGAHCGCATNKSSTVTYSAVARVSKSGFMPRPFGIWGLFRPQIFDTLNHPAVDPPTSLGGLGGYSRNRLLAAAGRAQSLCHSTTRVRTPWNYSSGVGLGDIRRVRGSAVMSVRVTRSGFGFVGRLGRSGRIRGVSLSCCQVFLGGLGRVGVVGRRRGVPLRGSLRRVGGGLRRVVVRSAVLERWAVAAPVSGGLQRRWVRSPSCRSSRGP